MKREVTNVIRFILEELLPPIVRDSRLLTSLMVRVFGTKIADWADLRQNVHRLTPERYRAAYENYPHVHADSGTDNSTACMQQIAQNITGGEICDVGCGRGYLINYLKSRNLDKRFYGVDFIIDEKVKLLCQGVEFYQSDILSLPFPDKKFDTVISTHTLEHIPNITDAILELRRICHQRLIIVVPLEREYFYTFNPHFHFFPYAHSFLKFVPDVPKRFSINKIGRDWFYQEDLD